MRIAYQPDRILSPSMVGELYKNAITLNNLGVHLLGQGAAKQALETLRDAVDTFRVSCDPSMYASDGLAGQSLSSLTDEKVQKASEQVKNPARTGNRASVEMLCWEDLSVSSSHTLSAAANAFGRECWAAFSVRTDVAVSQRDREFDSSIFMYNYALAHLAYMSEGNATLAKKSALSLFRMSFSILFKKVEERVEDDGDTWESVSIESATGLTVAVLSNLAHIFLSEARNNEASACLEKLKEIFENLATVERMHSVFVCSTIAAAAA